MIRHVWMAFALAAAALPTALAAQVCGNGVIETGESCDNGTNNSDLEPDGCRTDCRWAYCGDNVTDSGEECDDGGFESPNGDGCDANCTRSRCGNGEVDPETEECDDNDLTSGDGCDANCRVTGCGSGIVTTGESCDDGNLGDNDACLTSCLVSTRCCLPNVCGDGLRNALEMPDDRFGEACDDGNTVDGDDCRSDCGQDYALCGNGVIDMGETCDLGPVLNSIEPNADCRPDCQVARCGDGVVDDEADPAELCDSTAGCMPDCTFR